MLTEAIIFGILAFVGIVTGIAVVTAKNPIYAVLFLVVNFFTIAMFYLVLSAQFVAFLQILVYAGAIMVLFLFVIMLLNMTGDIERIHDKLPAQKWVASLFAIGLLAEIGVIMGTGLFKLAPRTVALGTNFGTARPVGEPLFSKYLLPFEVTSVLLLIGMVGSIVLAKRRTY